MLVSKGLKLAFSDFKLAYGYTNFENYDAIIRQDISQKEKMITLVHECVHLFYFLPPIDADERFHSLEDAIDKEVERIRHHTPNLAKHIFSAVKNKGTFSGFVKEENLPSYWAR